jgi:hypothetical protein
MDKMYWGLEMSDVEQRAKLKHSCAQQHIHQTPRKQTENVKMTLAGSQKNLISKEPSGCFAL